MTNDLLEIEKELVHLWWRVPLALSVIIFPFAFLNHINELEISLRRSGDPAQGNPFMVKPTSLPFLRLLALAMLTRFGFVFFASHDHSWRYEISKLEALFWLFYMGFLFPAWMWTEKELLRMRANSNHHP